jgi:hypothetical protein
MIYSSSFEIIRRYGRAGTERVPYQYTRVDCEELKIDILLQQVGTEISPVPGYSRSIEDALLLLFSLLYLLLSYGLSVSWTLSSTHYSIPMLSCPCPRPCPCPSPCSLLSCLHPPSHYPCPCSTCIRNPHTGRDRLLTLHSFTLPLSTSLPTSCRARAGNWKSQAELTDQSRGQWSG